MHSDLKAINCNINQHKIFQVKHFGLPNATDGEVSRFTTCGDATKKAGHCPSNCQNRIDLHRCNVESFSGNKLCYQSVGQK